MRGTEDKRERGATSKNFEVKYYEKRLGRSQKEKQIETAKKRKPAKGKQNGKCTMVLLKA